MLVLSRKVGQRLVIGGGITVVVKRIAGQRVTLGIEAPDAIKIIRGELPSYDPVIEDHVIEGPAPHPNSVDSSLFSLKPR